MRQQRMVTLVLPEEAIRNIREALDHHVRAMVWRKNNRPHELEQKRAIDEIAVTNATLDLIERQLYG